MSISDFLNTHINRPYIASGVPAFEDRTKEEKVKHCRRINGFYLGLDGIMFTREKPCHVYKGDVVCENCLGYRKYKRSSDYVTRLESAKDSALSYTTVKSQKELGSLTRAARRRGCEIMAIPVSETGDEKIVFVDGYFDHSGDCGKLERINFKDAIDLATSHASLFSPKKVSGKLGKVTPGDAANEDGIPFDFATVIHRIILFRKNNPSHYQNALAYALAIRSDDPAVATPDNIQELITRREDTVFGVYEKMKLSPFWGKSVEERKYRADEISGRWMRIGVNGVNTYGNLDSFDKFTRGLIERIVDGYSKAIKEIDYDAIALRSMDDIATELGIAPKDMEIPLS